MGTAIVVGVVTYTLFMYMKKRSAVKHGPWIRTWPEVMMLWVLIAGAIAILTWVGVFPTVLGAIATVIATVAADITEKLWLNKRFIAQ